MNHRTAHGCGGGGVDCLRSKFRLKLSVGRGISRDPTIIKTEKKPESSVLLILTPRNRVTKAELHHLPRRVTALRAEEATASIECADCPDAEKRRCRVQASHTMHAFSSWWLSCGALCQHEKTCARGLLASYEAQALRYPGTFQVLGRWLRAARTPFDAVHGPALPA
jgi:hypothetical protein